MAVKKTKRKATKTGMPEKPSMVFYELCYRQYEFEMQETNQLYQRVSLVLVILSLLSGVVYKLGRIDILRNMFERVDVFIYYFAILVAVLLLAASVTCAVLFLLPRKSQYKTLASMKMWSKWRDDYREYINSSGPRQKEVVDHEIVKEITEKLAEAQASNAPINERRRQYFYWSVLIASFAGIAVAVQSFMYFLLRVQGI